MAGPEGNHYEIRRKGQEQDHPAALPVHLRRERNHDRSRILGRRHGVGLVDGQVLLLEAYTPNQAWWQSGRCGASSTWDGAGGQ